VAVHGGRPSALAELALANAARPRPRSDVPRGGRRQARAAPLLSLRVSESSASRAGRPAGPISATVARGAASLHLRIRKLRAASSCGAKGARVVRQIVPLSVEHCAIGSAVRRLSAKRRCSACDGGRGAGRRAVLGSRRSTAAAPVRGNLLDPIHNSAASCAGARAGAPKGNGVCSVRAPTRCVCTRGAKWTGGLPPASHSPQANGSAAQPLGRSASGGGAHCGVARERGARGEDKSQPSWQFTGHKADASQRAAGREAPVRAPQAAG
jgi:hypothetical protein